MPRALMPLCKDSAEDGQHDCEYEEIDWTPVIEEPGVASRPQSAQERVPVHFPSRRPLGGVLPLRNSSKSIDRLQITEVIAHRFPSD